MPIAVTCQCGKTLNVRDDLAGKAVKCPACQQVVRVGAGAAKPAAARPAAAAPGAARPKAAPGTKAASGTAVAPGAARPTVSQTSEMDGLFEEAGFTVKTGQFCPQCNQALRPGAVLCTHCGFHLESGSMLQGHNSSLAEHDGAEAQLRHAADNMRRAKELDDRLQGAGMPAWVMALILFILGSCTAVGVIAVNVSRRTKDSGATFNALATMLLLAGIAFTAVSIGAQCIVIYRAFKSSPKEGMFVLLIPLYVFYFAFVNFKKVGLALIVCIITGAIGGVLFALSGMSASGQL